VYQPHLGGVGAQKKKIDEKNYFYTIITSAHFGEPPGLKGRDFVGVAGDLSLLKLGLLEGERRGRPREGEGMGESSAVGDQQLCRSGASWSKGRRQDGGGKKSGHITVRRGKEAFQSYKSRQHTGRINKRKRKKRYERERLS